MIKLKTKKIFINGNLNVILFICIEIQKIKSDALYNINKTIYYKKKLSINYIISVLNEWKLKKLIKIAQTNNSNLNYAWRKNII